jgi:UDP-glucose 4-epimerase
MRIAITGGAGFIASHIADAYAALGHQLLIIDDLSSGRREQVPAAAQFVHADIRSSEARAAIAAFRPDVLNHHAAQMDVRRSVADPVFDSQVNIGGFLNLLEAAKSAGTRRVIFASSGGAAYGEQERFPADEGHPTAPASPYGVAKRAGELYLDSYRQMYGLSYLALRYANVYGPRQNAHGEAGVVAIFAERCLRHEGCTIFGDGDQTRDFVYVDDVAAANVGALTSGEQGAINIGTGVETSVNQIYALVAKAAGHPMPVVHASAKVGEQRRSVLDTSKAKAILSWRPGVTLEEGITRTVAYFRSAT